MGSSCLVDWLIGFNPVCKVSPSCLGPGDPANTKHRLWGKRSTGTSEYLIEFIQALKIGHFSKVSVQSYLAASDGSDIIWYSFLAWRKLVYIHYPMKGGTPSKMSFSNGFWGNECWKELYVYMINHRLPAITRADPVLSMFSWADLTPMVVMKQNLKPKGTKLC